jgi:membrane fusion protein (multidrug efflux system)
MSRIESATPRFRSRGTILVAAVFGIGLALAAWKQGALAAANAAPAGAEPAEVIAATPGVLQQHRPTISAIGTVIALRSVTLRNELAGTVRSVALAPGRIVEPGTVLVALDVSVERAELRSREAQVTLATTALARLNRLLERRAVSQEEVDRAVAERDMAAAEIDRIRAVIERKTIRAPFRARIGMADLHVGQFLSEGTVLTTLQGIDDAVHVDFAVSQAIAAGLAVGDSVRVAPTRESTPVIGRIVAIDARLDPTTRNAVVRARLGAGLTAAPGGAVRVEVPAGSVASAVAVPVNALRSGPEGEFVWVIEADQEGAERSRLRPVRAGAVLGDTVLLLDGLEAGERVATSGSFKLREGALVAIAAAPAAGQGGPQE